MTWLLVAVGGGLGAAARYLLGPGHRDPPDQPVPPGHPGHQRDRQHRPWWAARLGRPLPAPTLTKAVDQLVAANLVYRRADRHDRRRVLIYLTARGRRLHARLAGKPRR